MNKYWAIAHRSFSKERLCDCLINCSLKKSKWKIALFVPLCKRAKELSLFRSFKKKERGKMSDRSFLKWANAQPWGRSTVQYSHFSKVHSWQCSSHLPTNSSSFSENLIYLRLRRNFLKTLIFNTTHPKKIKKIRQDSPFYLRTRYAPFPKNITM